MKQAVFDSNIFIRLLTRDLESQYQKAREMFVEVEDNKIEAMVSILVINEIIWILDNYYLQKRNQYIPELLKILSLKNIKIIEIDKNLLFKILEIIKSTKIDFTDIYLFNTSQGRDIFSFDKDFEKLTTLRLVQLRGFSYG